MKTMYPLENQWCILFMTIWLYGNSSTWAYYLRLHARGTNETNSIQKVKQRFNLLSMILRIQSFTSNEKKKIRSKCLRFVLFLFFILRVCLCPLTRGQAHTHTHARTHTHTHRQIKRPFISNKKNPAKSIKTKSKSKQIQIYKHKHNKESKGYKRSFFVE